MAKARPLRTAARKPEAKAAKSSTRGAPPERGSDRKTAPARAAKPVAHTRAETSTAEAAKVPARQAAPNPAVPPPLPAPIASFTF